MAQVAAYSIDSKSANKNVWSHIQWEMEQNGYQARVPQGTCQIPI